MATTLAAPSIYIDGQPYHRPISVIENMSEGLPSIGKDEASQLGALLRKHSIENESNKDNGSFWSDQLLCHILSKSRVRKQLKTYGGNAETYLNHICTDIRSHEGSTTPTYLKIFALLILIDKGGEIGNFVENRVSDQSLPVFRDKDKENVFLYHKQNPNQPIKCFMTWKVFDREAFEVNQWRLLTPFFYLDNQNQPRHYLLHDKTILPWCQRDENIRSSSAPSQNDGAFASVTCVKIAPTSHGFHEVLKNLDLKGELFALKRLRDKDSNNKAVFQNEVEQLRRFNGKVHKHLVTLLATYSYEGIRPQFTFLFPYADCTLDQYWENRDSEPEFSTTTVRWVSKQCSGIMGAMNIIHVPTHLKDPGVMRYGRHGDIKPDNILLFNPSLDERGILVISDMGLSSFNKDTSRSNIPNSQIPGVPGYRPPECEVKGGTISRSYDVWTLGCLFLEILTWLLGGLKFIQEFDENRTTVYITGAKNNIFFDLKQTREGAHVAQVKEQVTQWFDKLHDHPNCSRFVHESLNIIEREMLVVLSQDRKRSSAKELEKKFQELDLKCLADDDYCIEGIPEPRKFRAAPAVTVPLNETAEKTIEEFRAGLQTHEGETNNSMLPEDLQRMDDIAGNSLALPFERRV